MKPIIDKRKCPAQVNICGVMAACPTGAIIYVEDEREPLGARMVLDETRCTGCGLCVAACACNAIEMIS
jgi:Pyruvate/2-oxoacid:ferredoxin oxidoreductase delta subunit